jgi:hypothetical protein
LRSADLPSIERDKRIQRHVLRLEWRDSYTFSRQEPAKPSDYEALSDIRAGSKNGKGFDWCIGIRHEIFIRLSG